MEKFGISIQNSTDPVALVASAFARLGHVLRQRNLDETDFLSPSLLRVSCVEIKVLPHMRDKTHKNFALTRLRQNFARPGFWAILQHSLCGSNHVFWLGFQCWELVTFAQNFIIRAMANRRAAGCNQTSIPGPETLIGKS
jgi:hypothetical protein